MKRLILLAVRCYPAWWRARYGYEFIALLSQEGERLPVLLDVITHGMKVRFRGRRAGTRFGGNGMFSGARLHSARLALIGMAIMLPTLVLVVAAIFKHVVGFDAPFDALEPTMTPIVTHPVGETFFVLAPYAALVLALFPVTKLGLSWRTGRLSLALQLSAPPVNVVVAVASVLLAGFMILYWVAENI